MRQNEKRRAINRGNRTKVRTYIKKLRTAMDAGAKQDVDQVLPELAQSLAAPAKGDTVLENTKAVGRSLMTLRYEITP